MNPQGSETHGETPSAPWRRSGSGDGEFPPWPGAELFWRQIWGSVMQGGVTGRLGG